MLALIKVGGGGEPVAPNPMPKANKRHDKLSTKPGKKHVQAKLHEHRISATHIRVKASCKQVAK